MKINEKQVFMEIVTDKFAKGMAHWEESFDSSTLQWDKFQFVQFKKYLHGRMLELGAGFGRISRFVCKEVEFQSLTLSEPSPLFYSRLVKNFSGFKNVTTSDALVEDFNKTEQNGFDVVYSVHVLEHIENDREFIINSLNLVKPGGTMIVSVPALNFLYSDLDREIGHFRRYDKKMLKNLFSDLDVTVLHLRYSDILGVIGSLIVSKIGKKNYQGSTEKKKSFIQLASIYSKLVVPIGRAIESIITPPIGLNLTIVVRKGAALK
ncbi:MAG: class I SAM-dependent methyltransferase [Bdellovibrionaceae bacterium]|nr:class I SAM-dependent methyltransferase [Pseudobdellovibrionaceae bacterium]